MKKTKIKNCRGRKRWFKKVYSHRSKIWFKVSIGLILMGVIPVTLLSILYFNQMRQEVYSEANDYSYEILRGIAESINHEISALENISIDIAYNDEIQNICLNNNNMSTANINDLISAIRLDISFKLSNNRDVTDVYLFLPSGKRYVLFGDARFKFNLETEYLESFLQDIYNQNGYTVLSAFSASHQQEGLRKSQDERRDIDQCILIGRVVRSLETGDTLGVILMRVNEDMLSRRLEGVDIGDESEIIVYDETNRVISSTEEEEFFVGEPLPQYAGEAKESLTVRAIEKNGIVGTFGVVDMPIQDLDWQIKALVSRSAIDNRLAKVFINLVLLLIPVSLTILLWNRLFYRILAKPLNELVTAMNLAEDGDLTVYVENETSDEIGRVARSFNKMIGRIRQLLEDVTYQEREKRNAELAALRAQINLHFLSNTLNTAKCMAKVQKADNIEGLLTSLIELLHISMDLRSEVIPLKEEIQYIESYVDIMQHRNYTSIDVIYEIQPEIEISLVPKLILQPIVENALTHGFNRKSTDAQVIIKASGNDKVIRILVTDNGNGIKANKKKSVLLEDKNLNQSRFSGIGLPNVDRRIKMLYGEEYGLHIESIYLMYTTVTLTLPNIRRENSGDEDNGC